MVRWSVVMLVVLVELGRTRNFVTTLRGIRPCQCSVGINGTVLNNVNASPQVLATSSLEKVKALADVFRPYGIKVYLSVNFASPIQLGRVGYGRSVGQGGHPVVEAEMKEIYTLIPDFGGFW